MATNTRLHLKLSLPRPEFLHRKSQPLPPTPEENEEEFQFARQETGDSEDATDWIKSTIRDQGRWERHMSLIQIDCPHNMAGLRRLGRLSKSEGTKACRKMVRIPVLYDEIGCFLWEKLAELERGPDFGREDEEKAAEYARGVTYRTMMALDERFRFDQPAVDGDIARTTRIHGRARQDSEPVSPKHIHQPQADSSPQEKRPSIPHACNFCRSSSACERPTIPAEIAADALAATRGRIVDDQQAAPLRGSPHARLRLTRSLSRSGQTPPRAPVFFNHSRRSSNSSSLIWRHDSDQQHPDPGPSSLADARRSASSSGRRGPAKGPGRARSRDDTLGGRVGSVVGSLGRGVVVAIGGSMAHGYGQSGRVNRNGSLWSV
ncbi:hypothetical protein KVR01_012556 [Diaporthe batatas]|uniref:uncharacterized protein n=1 Tax=Diaporthe batatas TaxID=748121 RepID=UPI001D03612C|nr:uncharacterized protein KVR01_012556 [Diaporthe batatas]KAG8157514.1 hypothetical protein KVR01_012556 [Diaporthe batatas]